MADTTESVVLPDNKVVILDDKVQHGIDDDPNNDAEKGAALGGVGGAVTGAIAGSAVGPVGTVVGGVVGAVAGAVASGYGVAAVDRVDNDNKVSGLGKGVSIKDEDDDTVKAPTTTIY